MELCYVTERIIALWYRDDAQGVLEHATTLLRGKHADNYMVIRVTLINRRMTLVLGSLRLLAFALPHSRKRLCRIAFGSKVEVISMKFHADISSINQDFTIKFRETLEGY